MKIKYATTADITAIAAVEAECFPPAEAATEEEFIERVKYYGNHFWLMYEDGKLMELSLHPLEHASILGNIYIGKVRNIVKNMNIVHGIASFFELIVTQMTKSCNCN